MKKLLLILAALFSATVILSAADDFVIIRMVRHGQPGVKGTEFTPEMKAGWIRLGLTPLGIRQAQITGEYLKKEGRTYTVIASPQERASETANIICSILKTTFTLDKDLREVGNPIRETLPELRKRFKNIDPKENMLLTEEQAKGFKESNKVMGERGKTLIMKLVKSGRKGPFLLVSHGGFMNATTFTLTGKRSAPWNCGMIELKVNKEGKAVLVKAAYPEVLSCDLITDNQTTFFNNPWYGKFSPHKGKRPEDVKFVAREFENLAAKKNSSWKKSRAKKATLICKENSVSLKAAKEAFSISSPLYPVSLAGKYVITIKAKGKGTGVMYVSGAGSKCKKEIPLTAEEKEYTLEAGAHKKYGFHQINFTAKPESYFTITSFKMTPVK